MVTEVTIVTTVTMVTKVTIVAKVTKVTKVTIVAMVTMLTIVTIVAMVTKDLNPLCLVFISLYLRSGAQGDGVWCVDQWNVTTDLPLLQV